VETFHWKLIAPSLKTGVIVLAAQYMQLMFISSGRVRILVFFLGGEGGRLKDRIKKKINLGKVKRQD
jgi:hypothetical protein